MYSWKSGTAGSAFSPGPSSSHGYIIFLRCRLVGIGSSQNHATQGFAPPAHRNASSLSRSNVLEIAVEALRLHSSAATSLWLTVFQAAGPSERKWTQRQKKVVVGLKTQNHH